jgi:hypothetical protein
VSVQLSRSGSAIALAAGASLLVGSSDAAAAPFSLAITANGTDTETLSFGKFDSSSGTLTGVTFTLASSVAGAHAGMTTSFTGGEGGTAASTTNAVFDIAGPGSGGPESVSLFHATGAATASCAANFPTQQCSASDSTISPPSFAVSFTVTNLSDLASYQSSGGLGTFDVDFDLGATLTLNTCISGQPGSPVRPNECSPTGSAEWVGTLTVSFQFDPGEDPQVPEPGSLGVLAFSLAGLIAVTRRRRSPSA